MSTGYDYRKYAVLYVDDEEQALKYFRKGLMNEFQVLTANNVAAALEVLGRDAAKIGVVITDQRMPGQQGTELLARVHRQWPNIVRILVTAYADIDSAIGAVNDGAIYKYITKPADFPQLRETLRNALELFITRTERDTLLAEKMSTLRQVVIADRVRSFAEMAGGISHHVRNSMTAMSCFLEEAGPGGASGQLQGGGAKAAAYTDALWALASQERDRLVKIVQKVEQSVVAPACRFADEMTADALVQRAAESAAPEIEAKRLTMNVAPGLLPLKLDAQMIVRLLKTLLVYAGRLGQRDGQVNIVVKPAPSPSNAPGIQVCVIGQGPAWTDRDVAAFFTPFAFPSSDPSDLGLDMLVAFYIAYHHGGDLLVHKTPPAGPGFELLLPLNPADISRPEWQDGLVEKLFTPSAPKEVSAPAA